MKNDIYQDVTNRIIDIIENHNTLPFSREWLGPAAALPFNSATGRGYNGINILILWTSALDVGYTSPEWMTYKQAKDVGLQVRKNERSRKIVFFKQIEVDSKETENEKDIIPMLRTYSVFNADQLDGESSELIARPSRPDLDSFLDSIFSNGDVQTIVGDPAFLYEANLLRFPDPDHFVSEDAYYAIQFHELIHWTGYKDRLERAYGKPGTQDYAFEELIAELGAAFLCAEFGIDREVNHATYLDHYLDLLKRDNRAIFRAAAAASKACDYLHDLAIGH